MWNNAPGNNGYGSTPPPFPGFPSADPGFPTSAPAPAPHAGYNPSYTPSYGPPSGVPSTGYGGPPGPPQPGFNTMPGPAPSFPSFGPPSSAPPHGYGPPPGAPPGYGPPPGAPPSGYGAPSGPSPHSYGPPSGPPPVHSPYGPPSGPPPVQKGSYPGQQYHQQQQQQSGYPGQFGAPSPNQYGAPGGVPPMPPTQQQNYGPHYEGPNHRDMQPYFKYSQCTGKKKALCIGINYKGQRGELRGCINDAQNIQNFLCTNYGYKKEDIVMLTDDATNPRQLPTKANILNAMQWLVNGAAPNDSLFFHYSGHGGQVKDHDGDEGDGYDEVIYPLDYEKNGEIVDDLMHKIMVKPLPAGCRLTSIFDSCHSGSALDLPYIYSTEGKVKEPNLAAEAGQGLLSAVSSYAKGDMGGVFKSAMGLVKTASGNTQKAEKITKATRASPADVISWSGCKDSQTSADTQEAGQATGAMSHAFVSALSKNKQQSYQQLLGNVRGILKAKYSQKPQLASSHPMDTNIMFIC